MCQLSSKVERDAKQGVLQAKGNLDDPEWTLSMTCLQFGKYQGKAFFQLLQNDVEWTVMAMADHSNQGKRPRELKMHSGTTSTPFTGEL